MKLSGFKITRSSYFGSSVDSRLKQLRHHALCFQFKMVIIGVRGPILDIANLQPSCIYISLAADSVSSTAPILWSLEGFHLCISLQPLFAYHIPSFFFPASPCLPPCKGKAGSWLEGDWSVVQQVPYPCRLGDWHSVVSHTSNPLLWADTVTAHRVQVPLVTAQSFSLMELPWYVWHCTSAETMTRASELLTMSWCHIFIVFLSSKCSCPEIKEFMTGL